MKKFISVLLIIAMVCTMIPLFAVSAFAETVDSSQPQNAEQALIDKIGADKAEKLKSIRSGENGDYNYEELFSILGDAEYDLTNRVEITSDSNNTMTLVDNTTYVFSKNVTMTAANCQSAMVVPSDAKVFLEIPAGVTVTIIGGDADGTIGAGAGIEVPASATLVIKGDGKLIVKGGNAGDGQNGSAAENSKFSTDNDGRMYAGNGGNGGNGGGGAAAAIGGKGGNGGTGGVGGIFEGRAGYTLNGHPAVWVDGRDCNKNGSDGTSGEGGTNGGDCGKVLILGKINVVATAGNKGADGVNGANGKRADDTGSGYFKDYCAGSSGGGGAGQGGLQPMYGIGGGGVGGSGGGGGGTGATRVGSGFADGASGSSCGAGKKTGSKQYEQKGGDGGSSQNHSIQGSNGTVYINRESKVEGRPCFYFDAVLEQASNLIVTIGEAPLVLGDITKVNNYQKNSYESLALALFEAVTHFAHLDTGFKVNVPQTGVQKERNGAFRYTDSGNWYKEMVDTSGGYIYLVLDAFQECARSDFNNAYEDDSNIANPYDFVESVFNKTLKANGNTMMDLYGVSHHDTTMKELLHKLFFDDHYCEPDGGNRKSPGYTKDHRTEGTHTFKDNALRVIHNTYIKMSEANTNRTLTLSYDTARDHTAGDYHFYYHFNSMLVVEHDKKDGINGSNWMKYLPQSMPITEVNMPGSHDAGMYYTNHLSAFMFLTQTLSITDQLKSGCRFFDIRLNAEDEQLRVYHSSALGRDTRDDSPLTLDKVNDMCEQFLKENPDQFIIIMYNAEKRSMSDPNESRLFEKFKKDHNIVNYCDENGICAEQASKGKVDTSKTRHYLINLEGDNIVVPSVGFSKNTIYYVFAHDVDKWEDHYDTFPDAKIGWLENAFSVSPKQITGGKTIYWSNSSDAKNSIVALRNHETSAEQLVLDSPKIVFASSFWANSFPSIPFFVPNPRDSGDDVNEWLNKYDFIEGKHYGYVLLNCVNPYTCSKIYMSNITERDKLYGGDYDGDGKEDELVSVVGSLFSNGILWIVVAVVVAAVVGSVVFVNVNKKKKDIKDE